ncbi:PTS transporter subunit EIIC [Lacrimispora indolis]|uniref:PTS transporter subunit EIIC n=1 Tax=Lacrimispora indolis TaxID=69825 RepID=UPI0003FC4642|nr:PTS transporter subunit EIIC [[Clostridium] methoxybenzovorans]
MIEQNIIEQIIEAIGGIDNIERISNCMTRFRVVVFDKDKIDKERLKEIPGVLGVAGKNYNPQVILGPGNAEYVRGEVQKMMDARAQKQAVVNKADIFREKKKNRSEIFTMISQVFTPMIPALAGTGLLYGLLRIFQYIFIYFKVDFFNPAAIADGGSVFMAALSVIAGSFFSIMNIAVASQAAKTMGGNPFVGMAIGAIVTNVGLLNGVSMSIFNLEFKSGMGGTLAALLGGFLVAILERKFRKVIPNVLQVHFPALFSILLTGIAVLFVIQPISGMIANALANVVIWLVYNAGAVGGAIISGTFLPLVALGIHHIVTPIQTTLLQEVGYTSLQGFLSLAGAGLAGVALGLLIKYRKQEKYKKLRAAVIGNLPTQLLGISEPMIYGISIPLWRPFIAANLGGACGGFVLGLFPGQGAIAMNVSGLLGALVNTKPGAYLLSYLAAVIGAAFFTNILGVKDENMEIFLGN